VHIVRIGSYRTGTLSIQFICKVLQLRHAPAKHGKHVSMLV
jgi:hypothetical protein